MNHTARSSARTGLETTRRGFGLLFHDGYRPWYVTKMSFDATPEEQKIFVADPASGSQHNRGSAIDLEAEGFTVYEAEWWHLDHDDWREYALQNATLGELGR